MSVINQMLKDLEQRRSSGFDDKNGILDNLVVGNSQSGRNWITKLVIVLLIVVIGLLAWLLWERFIDKSVSIPTAVATSPLTVTQTPIVPVVPLVQAPTPVVPTMPAEPVALSTTNKEAAVNGLVISPDVILRKANLQLEADDELVSVSEEPVARAISKPAEEKITKAEVTAKDKTVLPAGVSNKEVEISIVRHNEKSKGQAESLFSQATKLLKNRRSSEAVEKLKKVLSIDAKNNRARELLASLLFQNSQYDSAAEVLEAGIAQQPTQISFSLLLARVRMEQGRDTDAIVVLESQKPLARDYSDYYALLAALYQRSARHADAATIYTGLVKVFPGRAVWWMGLGISMQALEQSAEAVTAYKRALAARGLSADLQKFVKQRIRLLNS